MTNEKTSTRKGKGGPKTAEGKRRSSLNALKHGLKAKTPDAYEQIMAESGISYEETLASVREYYAPADPIEDQLVQRIARCVWRLSLASIMEENQLTRNPNPARPGVTYEKIMRFERLVDIHLHRAIQTLARKRESEPRIPEIK